jgi:transcriptional regulator with XRE-family HTH domain
VEPSFGRTVREARKRRALSQKQLADIAGIDFTYLSKIENDRMAPPSEKTLRAMAEALDADADELIRLAGKVPSDLAEFLVRDPEGMRFLRSFQGSDIETREQWAAMLRKEKRKQS